MKRYQVSVNGKQFVVEVEELADDQQVSVSAAPQSSPSVSPAAGQPAPQAAPVEQGVADGVEVNAPLTGKVLRVLVKPGDEVKTGDVLLTIEALKLENEIVSPVAGVVTGVFAQEGNVVETGKLLVTVKEG
ncbi:MAG: biotin/lipoyl-containing protein [Limnochordia bacterium]